jgi:hypothetical protein
LAANVIRCNLNSPISETSSTERAFYDRSPAGFYNDGPLLFESEQCFPNSSKGSISLADTSLKKYAYHRAVYISLLTCGNSMQYMIHVYDISPLKLFAQTG